MPLQNRVDPYGNIHDFPGRGTLMGNRGLLHNTEQQLVKPFQLKRWIICVLDFKNRRRQVMRPGHYTELFFKDEASALAAGHRPCAECQRSKFNDFKAAWTQGNQMAIGKIAELDEVLHHERLQKAEMKQHLSHLPNGVFVQYQGNPFLWYNEKLYPWSFNAYGQALGPLPGRHNVLTPPSIINALKEGYLLESITFE